MKAQKATMKGTQGPKGQNERPHVAAPASNKNERK